MTSQQKKLAMIVFTFICLVGGSGFIYVGYQLFQNRTSIFWIFFAYIVILTGIVIFFGYRFIGILGPSKEK